MVPADIILILGLESITGYVSKVEFNKITGIC